MAGQSKAASDSASMSSSSRCTDDSLQWLPCSACAGCHINWMPHQQRSCAKASHMFIARTALQPRRLLCWLSHCSRRVALRLAPENWRCCAMLPKAWRHMPGTPQPQQQLSSASCSASIARKTLQQSETGTHGHTRMLHDRHATRCSVPPRVCMALHRAHEAAEARSSSPTASCATHATCFVGVAAVRRRGEAIAAAATLHHFTILQHACHAPCHCGVCGSPESCHATICA